MTSTVENAANVCCESQFQSKNDIFSGKKRRFHANNQQRAALPKCYPKASRKYHTMCQIHGKNGHFDEEAEFLFYFDAELNLSPEKLTKTLILFIISI